MLRRTTKTILFFLVIFLWPTLALQAGGSKADYDRARSLSERTQGKVYRLPSEGEWDAGGTHYSYRVQIGPQRFEEVVVDAVQGTRAVQRETPQPIEAKLQWNLARKTKRTGPAAEISFVNQTAGPIQILWLDFDGAPKLYGEIKPGDTYTSSSYAGHVWLVKQKEGDELGLIAAKSAPIRVLVDAAAKKKDEKPTAPQIPPGTSPDGKWVAFIENHNLKLRNTATKATVALSNAGNAENSYHGVFHWSPDSNKVVVMQVEPAQKHPVHFVESSPKDQLQPKLHTHDYLKPGDRIEHPRPRMFDVATTKPIPIKDDLFPTPWSISDLNWATDSSQFSFLYNQRGHQLLRVIGVNASTGESRVVIEESSPTFVDYSQKTYLHDLPQTKELLWMSERSGWNHLWLWDTEKGLAKNAVTTGEWVVRRVERVDEEQRQVWFFAMGVRPKQDYYHQHLCRVNFDGSNFVVLTDGDGTHKVEFSRDRRWFVDTYSRVDQPPVTELRRSEDGALVCPLEQADASELTAARWTMPERFVAQGRDGQTDIYGVIYKPSNFDPAAKYPVIEEIYAGPHDCFVPQEWGLQIRQHAMAELGFIVVQIDGMGTNWRSRAFHDVAWRNLKDAGFPDRIAWLKTAAQTRPWMDLTRVGLYGGSAGGQNALAGLLHHGDFYKAAVADCGCHDNRLDKIWWNEAWLNTLGPWYEDNSNVTHAAKLQGKLLLIVGEIDTNVDPASTMQVVNALVKADKDFDLLVMPSTNHGAAETPYASRRRMDFFVRHLLSVEPREGAVR